MASSGVSVRSSRNMACVTFMSFMVAWRAQIAVDWLAVRNRRIMASVTCMRLMVDKRAVEHNKTFITIVRRWMVTSMSGTW